LSSAAAIATTASEIARRINVIDALNGIPHGVALVDRNHRLIGFNRYLEALTGYTGREVQGIRCDDILRSSLMGKGNPLQTVLETLEPLTLEGDIISHSRKKIPIRFHISPLQDLSETLLGTIITLEDLSLLKNMDKKSHGASGIEGVIGHSPQMQKIFELLPILARTDTTALITGETGTGKDLIAEAIHNASIRASHPFVKINCGALPESLLESELFGHSRGAFTGAERDKLGMFQLANGGTIFLTEIGDLPLPLQVKLLTVLDDREFFPLGSSKKVKVDVRVITATHRDLRELVRLGRFRQDLFYRLSVLRLHLPALRERSGDIRLLMDHFLHKICSHTNKRIKGFTAEAAEVLLRFAWPGNVRELRNVVEYSVMVCQDEKIRPEHLPAYIFSTGPQEPGPEITTEPEPETHSRTAFFGGQEPGRSGDSQVWPEMEKKMIMDAMVKARGKRAKAAEILGCARSTLWRKIKTYKLD
jgi:two-component system response regulator AtoC